MNETIKHIMTRRSTRAFTAEQIKEEELQAILGAGLYAPSATNKQPWHVTVIQKKEVIDLLSERFKAIAKISESEYLRRVGTNENFHVFYNAPTVVLLSGDDTKKSAAVDCAAAVENMLIAAQSLDIGSCWVGFIAYYLNSQEGKDYCRELGIPEGYSEFHAVALGYKKNPDAPAPERKPETVNYIR